jgi:hypothetical protein
MRPYRFAVVLMVFTPLAVDAEGRILARTAAGGGVVPFKDVT